MAEPGYQSVYHRRVWNENQVGCLLGGTTPSRETSNKSQFRRKNVRDGIVERLSRRIIAT